MCHSPRRLVAVAVVIAGITAAFMLSSVTPLRRVFPYEDHIASRLSVRPIAYVHVDLTRGIRVQMREIVAASFDAHAEQTAALRDGLRAALADRSVSELAFVWKAGASDPALGRDARVGRIVVVAWQEARDGLFVFPEREGTIAGIHVDFTVVRGDDNAAISHPLDFALVPHRIRPIQAIVFPHTIPIHSFEAALARLPEQIALGGTLDRDGMMLRSGTSWRAPRSGTTLTPFVPLDPGSILVTRLPSDLLPDVLRPFGAISGAVDAYVNVRTGAFALTGITLVRDDALVRLAAQLAPEEQSTALDGAPALVSIADTNRFIVEQQGGRTTVFDRTNGTSVLMAQAFSEGIVLTNDDKLAQRNPQQHIRIPGRCASGSRTRPAMYGVIHPQLQILISIHEDEDEITMCGKPMR